MGRRILVTGGAGFIGGALIERLLEIAQDQVICFDKLTYAGNRARLDEHIRRGLDFHQIDLADSRSVHEAVATARPDVVFHLAAESHVDRSIDWPDPFIATNIVGTANLLAACLALQQELKNGQADSFRFVHVSTDEVFGSAEPNQHFDATSPYRPRSPYSASKAAADHLVTAWHHTYSLPATITNCSNNYGPHQFPEKLIPHAIIRAVSDREIPIYGDGGHQRDWIFVNDHVDGLLATADRGVPGGAYLFGARCVLSNVDLVHTLCQVLDELAPGKSSYAERVVFVPDRPGHDRRYSLDPGQTETALGWKASTDLDTGLRTTVAWYLENESWWRDLLRAGYDAGRRGLRV
jgi:dTDP-glucose 4,6-dehydratase